MKKPIIVTACLALLASSLLAASPAVAAGAGHTPQIIPGTPQTLASGLVSPLSVDVDASGNAYVTQNFAGLLARVTSAGIVVPLASVPGLEVSAVSTRGTTLYYSELTEDHGVAWLMSLEKGGTPKKIADIQAYEAKYNPDGKAKYGFVGLPKSCADTFPPPSEMSPPAVYTGTVDTHPYGSVATASGVYIADAGANAVLKVGYDGKVSTVAVLPGSPPITVTPALAQSFGFPACAAGYKYVTEPVPTAVALGPDGQLYVTTLPGGPEDPSLGLRGGIYKIDPATGATKRIIGSLGGATGLSVTPSGSIYVAELFGGATGAGRVSVVRVGAAVARNVIALPSPAAIKFYKDKLYVTTDVLADGKLTVVPLTYK